MALPAIPDDHTYLRPPQRVELEERLVSLREQLKDKFVVDKAAVAKQIRATEATLATDTPPEVKGEDLDALVAEEKRLREFIQDGMLSSEEMRRAPDTAVTRHMAWESASAKAVGCRTRLHAIQRRKNILLIIHRDSDDPELCNTELLRPRRSSLGMASAFVQPKTAYSFPSEQFQENYEETFGTEDQRVARLEARLQDLEAKLAASAQPKKVAKPAKRASPGPQGPAATV